MSAGSRVNPSTIYSIDPFHYRALQDTNEALKSEVHRLTRADEDNTAKLKLQVLENLKFFFSFSLPDDKKVVKTDLVN